MTLDQIKALKPGPELDRAVYHALFDEQASLPGPRRLVAYPSYSATWKALGLVVEEMERRGWWWRRKRSADRFYSGFFRFNVLYEDPEPDIPGESDAHAAAKAALLAIAAERAGRGEG